MAIEFKVNVLSQFFIKLIKNYRFRMLKYSFEKMKPDMTNLHLDKFLNNIDHNKDEINFDDINLLKFSN